MGRRDGEPSVDVAETISVEQTKVQAVIYFKTAPEKFPEMHCPNQLNSSPA
jgi:hypothetical protein